MGNMTWINGNPNSASGAMCLGLAAPRCRALLIGGKGVQGKRGERGRGISAAPYVAGALITPGAPELRALGPATIAAP